MTPEPTKILRFRRSERFLHWALAVPFVLLYASALAMVLLWNEPHPRVLRTGFAWAHRIFGFGLLLLPLLALVRGGSEWRTHWANLKEGWTWTRDDFRWLVLFPRSALDSRVRLPDQGKFNAAEKLNFMMVSAGYPLYIGTGMLMLLPGAAFVPWLAHFAMALLGIPLVVGHIVMATINPSTRIGLSGMITGWVDREWAKHHYRRWYRESFEKLEPVRTLPAVVLQLQQPAQARCDSCGEILAFDSWEELLRRSFQVEPLFCPACGSELETTEAEIRGHLEQGAGSRPLGARTPRSTSPEFDTAPTAGPHLPASAPQP